MVGDRAVVFMICLWLWDPRSQESVAWTKLKEFQDACWRNIASHGLTEVSFLQDFLRSIPHKLLLTELYDEWMTALEKINHQEKTEAMKE